MGSTVAGIRSSAHMGSSAHKGKSSVVRLWRCTHKILLFLKLTKKGIKNNKISKYQFHSHSLHFFHTPLLVSTAQGKHSGLSFEGLVYFTKHNSIQLQLFCLKGKMPYIYIFMAE